MLLQVAAAHSTDWTVLAGASSSQRRDGAPGFPMHVLHDALKSGREVDKVTSRSTHHPLLASLPLPCDHINIISWLWLHPTTAPSVGTVEIFFLLSSHTHTHTRTHNTHNTHTHTFIHSCRYIYSKILSCTAAVQVIVLTDKAEPDTEIVAACDAYRCLPTSRSHPNIAIL